MRILSGISATYIDGRIDGQITVVSGAQGEGVLAHHIYHHSGSNIDGVCGKGGDLVGIGGPVGCGKGLVGKFTKQEGAVRMGKFAGINIDGQSTTGKYERAHLRADHPYGSVFTMAWQTLSGIRLTLSAIGTQVVVGGTAMVDEGSGALQIDTAAPAGCRSTTAPVSCLIVSTPINVGSGCSTIGGDGHSGIDHQIGSFQIDRTARSRTTDHLAIVLP